MRTAALLLAPALALFAPAAPAPAAGPPPAPPPPGIERFTLGNGLRVALRPLAGAKAAAVVVLYDFGENADPEGRSGLAHLCEHLYVTAAAGGAGPRTAEALARAYPLGWNAQTGWDYTVFASVVPAEGLEGELRDAAARMGALRATPADLEREVPRLLEELGNMYGGSPALGAANHARQALHWERAGRGGGIPAEVRAVTAEEAGKALASWYRAGNARLVVAGALDPAAARKSVEALFGPVPRGERPPDRTRSLPPTDRDLREGLRKVRAVEGPPDLFGEGPHACIGWRTPRLATGAEDPAFLLLAVRLWARMMQPAGDSRQRPRVQYAPLDDPGFLLVGAGIGKDETPDAAVARLEAFVRETLAPPFRPTEKARARMHLAHFLATMDLPDTTLAPNPYLAAFGLGRRDQLGLDGPGLAAALDRLTEEDFDRARAEWFADRAAAAVIPGK